jgi:outer membrane immunogenic protein
MVRLCLAFAAMLNVAAVAPAAAGDLSLPGPAPVDLRPVRATPKPAVWSSCHLGIHLGGGIVSGDFSGPFTDARVPSTFGAPTSIAINGGSMGLDGIGLLGGGQVGCDLQLTRKWVIGIDADVSGATISGDATETNTTTLLGPVIPAPTTVSSSGTLTEKTNAIVTATGRFGYVFIEDRGLIYGKGGVAWASESYSFSGQDATTACTVFSAGACTTFGPTISTPFNFNASETRRGWTAGFGVEWAVTVNWSAKLEYDYVNFGSRNVAFTGAAFGAATNINVNQNVHEMKFGVNYLFGG